jgi:sugar/nucleoside kinase (ribokinase family)
MKPILVVGETNVDVVMHGSGPVPTPGREVIADDCVLTLGSASAICAMGLARLGNQVAFVSRVGADLWGDYCLETLKAGGVDLSSVVRDPALKTGVTVSISSSADRALITYVGSIAAVTESDVPDTLLGDVQHLHVSSYFLQARLREDCLRLFDRARHLGVTTSLDPGCDPEDVWGPDVKAVARAADVFLPNDVELTAITGSASPEAGLLALENGRTRTVVKLGRAGAMTREDGEVIRVGAFSVQALDTTGAGDSFNAGFLHAFLRGAPIRDCLIFGNACGALSTCALGGTASQPTVDEVTALVATAEDRW